VRIITGIYKGRRLLSVPDKSIRPATDRVKGSIFNALQNRLALNGARVLDLFAGSGGLGLEALSRGAGSVTFVDDSRVALDIVRKNALNLDCLDACTLVCDDAFSFVAHEPGEFDLIFADPPYASEQTGLLPGAVFGHKLLERSGFLIIEHAKRVSFDASPLYRAAVQKEFGATRITFFAHADSLEVS
jgi:16S rRNA (guanine966-N2)-methyltransferase